MTHTLAPFNQLGQQIHIPLTYWHFSICWNVGLQICWNDILFFSFQDISWIIREALWKTKTILIGLFFLILIVVWFDKKDYIFSNNNNDWMTSELFSIQHPLKKKGSAKIQ